MDYLDIVDDKNIPTGEVVERGIAHEKGLFHRHVSCWIVNKKGQVLLQRRAYTDLFNLTVSREHSSS